MNRTEASYLLPYFDAARRWGGEFGALLWANQRTQRARFEAIRLSLDLGGRSILDAGCGRADLLAYLIDMEVRPAEYIGLEAVDALAERAEARATLAKKQSGVKARILRADFVREPLRLFLGSDIIVFSGSLNTFDAPTFYATLGHAFQAAAEALVFNFLASPCLAGRDYLVWHAADDVLQFARGLTSDVRVRTDYLPGDCTLCLVKEEQHGNEHRSHHRPH